MDFRNLVNLLEFQVFPFSAIIRVILRFPDVFMVLSDLGNFIQVAESFVKVMSKYPLFHLNRLNRLNYDHFIND